MEPRGQAPRGPSGRSTWADKTPPTSMKLSSLLQLPAMVEKEEEYGKVMSPPLPS